MGSSAASTVPGSCFCGAVRFEITLPTTFCVHCHCSMCRRLHGAGYVTWIALPKAQLAIVAGAETLRRHASSEHGTRAFCAECGTSLLCELADHPDQIDVPLANLAGPIDREPEMHVFFSDRVAWAPVDDGLPKLGGSTGVEPMNDSPKRGARS